MCYTWLVSTLTLLILFELLFIVLVLNFGASYFCYKFECLYVTFLMKSRHRFACICFFYSSLFLKRHKERERVDMYHLGRELVKSVHNDGPGKLGADPDKVADLR